MNIRWNSTMTFLAIMVVGGIGRVILSKPWEWSLERHVATWGYTLVLIAFIGLIFGFPYYKFSRIARELFMSAPELSIARVHMVHWVMRFQIRRLARREWALSDEFRRLLDRSKKSDSIGLYLSADGVHFAVVPFSGREGVRYQTVLPWTEVSNIHFEIDEGHPSPLQHVRIEFAPRRYVKVVFSAPIKNDGKFPFLSAPPPAAREYQQMVDGFYAASRPIKREI